jgi:ADP-ribosylglycohydrolase
MKPIGHRCDRDHFRGTLFGGAIGDALGAPVEFLTIEQIHAQYGPKGIQSYDIAFGRRGAITDDTQMTLFTAEGLVQAACSHHSTGSSNPVESVYRAYLRWLYTQDHHSALPELSPVPSEGLKGESLEGWLIHEQGLYSRRAPGMTCFSALRSGKCGTTASPINNSKGCGGVMRVAPVGLLQNVENAFQLGCELAAITHGHPSGYLAAGCLSQIIHDLIHGSSLEASVETTLQILRKQEHHEECYTRLSQACEFAVAGHPSPEVLSQLGAGWVAEEALAISVYCALVYRDDFRSGVLLAVNHSGDSDSTGAITGNILGALLGESGIQQEWLDEIELKEVITQVAAKLLSGWVDRME